MEPTLDGQIVSMHFVVGILGIPRLRKLANLLNLKGGVEKARKLKVLMWNRR